MSSVNQVVPASIFPRHVRHTPRIEGACHKCEVRFFVGPATKPAVNEEVRELLPGRKYVVRHKLTNPSCTLEVIDQGEALPSLLSFVPLDEACYCDGQMMFPCPAGHVADCSSGVIQCVPA